MTSAVEDVEVQDREPRPYRPLRTAIIVLALTLIPFVQQPGFLVADTKFDLVVSPGRFLARSLHLWDSVGAFGQIQNQAYGYLFPMGPFFWLGHLIHLDMWVVQRLWWALLLNVAFFGTLRCADAIGLGKPWSRLVAAFSFTFCAHITTIIGGASVEAWPTAMAPWVLWAVVRGCQGGRERRWAAAAALLVCCAGGVNAVAVAAVLPLGAIWVFTHRGERRWRFFGWWTGLTALATLWWTVPLLLLGKYSYPFLDYIESSRVTTIPTHLAQVLVGDSDWVAYVDAFTYPAGRLIATTPYLVLDLMVVVAVGLFGATHRDNPQRRFLLWSILAGVVLVSLGYAGPGHGWFGQTRQDVLDGMLAPLRNVHKFDVVLRLPLALGVAFALGRLDVRKRRDDIVAAVVPVVSVIVGVGLLSPWLIPPSISPAGATAGVPNYWLKAADYLNRTADSPDVRGTRTLVLPAAAFGEYTWGWTHDDVMQALATATWGVRNVIPLTQPGNVVLLDAVTRAAESGSPDPQLSRLLEENGVGRVVVRNDLDRLRTGAPDPAYLQNQFQPLNGFQEVAAFGKTGGQPLIREDKKGRRIFGKDGLAEDLPAVQVFAVLGKHSRAEVVDDPWIRAALPGASAEGLVSPAAGILIADSTEPTGPIELTDSQRRRETAFAAVRRNVSSTMTREQPWLIDRRVHYHQLSDDDARWQSVASYDGIRGVTASSSQAWVNSSGPIDRGTGPEAALDGDPATAWKSSRGSGVASWRMNLISGTDVQDVTVTTASGVPAPAEITVSAGGESVSIDAPEPGHSYTVATGFGHVRSLTVSATPNPGAGVFALAEVQVVGLDVQRYVKLPDPGRHSVSQIDLVRDPGADPCSTFGATVLCNDGRGLEGDDGDTVARLVPLNFEQRYSVTLTGSPRKGDRTADLNRALPIKVTSTGSASQAYRAGPLAAVDGTDATTWLSAPGVTQPALRFRFGAPRVFGAIHLSVDPAAPASTPRELELTAGGVSRRVTLDGSGDGSFEPISGDRLRVRILSSDPAYDQVADDRHVMPPGVSTLELFENEVGGINETNLGAADLSLACGHGPNLDINGTAVPTRVVADLADVMAGRAEISMCSPEVSLIAGDNSIVARPTTLFRVDGIQLTDPNLVNFDTASRERPAKVIEWGNDRRIVRVVNTTSQRKLLVVSENFNPGWQATFNGQALTPQRVDGWRQGWWIPPTTTGSIVLTFTPQATFRRGFEVGILGLAVTICALLWRGRREDEPSPAVVAVEPTRLGQLLSMVAVALAAGFLAGTLAAVGALVLVLIAALPGVRRVRPYAVGAALFGVSGWMFYRQTSTPGLDRQVWVQIGLALVLAFAAGGLLRDGSVSGPTDAGLPAPDDGP